MGRVDVQSSHDKQSPRLLFDMSHTAGSALNSGIQRVVRNLAHYLPDHCRSDGFECVNVVWRDGHFYELQALEQGRLRPTYTELVRSFGATLPEWYQKPVEWLCRRTSESRLRKLLIPKPGHAGAFSLPLKLRAQWNRWLNELVPSLGRVHFRANDVLFMPDGYWVMPKIWREVSKVRQAGTQVHTLVYDIIALTHPECFVTGAPERFNSYVEQLASNSDHIFAISQTVAAQLVDDLRKRGYSDSSMPGISPFVLGADFHHGSAQVRPEIGRDLARTSRRAYLTVSTIEPRKNYMYALDAFEMVWSAGLDVQWIVAGRPGWKCESQLERMKNHREYGKRLHLFHDLSDDELNLAYQNVDGVICPSIAEGFGLPIVEGLHHGRQVMASDIEIHREVGGEACQYFSLSSPQSLADCLMRHSQHPASTTSAMQPALRLPTWQQSAAELWQKMHAATIAS